MCHLACHVERKPALPQGIFSAFKTLSHFVLLDPESIFSKDHKGEQANKVMSNNCQETLKNRLSFVELNV